MKIGSWDEYEWLEVDLRLREFLAFCPEAVLGKYIAITAVDSGAFSPSAADRTSGWIELDGIAYGPIIESIDTLPPGCCCRDCGGFDEWYLFQNIPAHLGAVCNDNPFVTLVAPPNVFRFINFGGFSLSDPAMGSVTDLFWRQLLWIRPDSYLGDGEKWLVFATRHRELFANVERLLKQGIG